jgi:hypothetical protein
MWLAWIFSKLSLLKNGIAPVLDDEVIQMLVELIDDFAFACPRPKGPI